MTALRKRPYLSFLTLGLLVFVVATFGSDVIARMTIRGEDFWQAVSQHLHYARSIGTTAWLLAPFLLLGLLAASTTKQKNFTAGLSVFLLGALLLGWLYFSAYQRAWSFMNKHGPTAAALSVGLLPVFSAIPLLVCLGLRWFVLRKKNEAGPNTGGISSSLKF